MFRRCGCFNPHHPIGFWAWLSGSSLPEYRNQHSRPIFVFKHKYAVTLFQIAQVRKTKISVINWTYLIRKCRSGDNQRLFQFKRQLNPYFQRKNAEILINWQLWIFAYSHVWGIVGNQLLHRYVKQENRKFWRCRISELNGGNMYVHNKANCKSTIFNCRSAMADFQS